MGFHQRIEQFFRKGLKAVGNGIKHIYNDIRTSSLVVRLFIAFLLVLVLVATIPVCTGHLETGFGGKTLWNWLEVVGIPVVVVLITAVFAFARQKEQRGAEEQRERDTELTREATLRAYLDDMTELILKHNLKNSKEESAERAVAHAQTFMALRTLDGQRKRVLIQFLKESQLINKDNRIISLKLVDLSGVEISTADLSGTDLSGVILGEADLRNSNLKDSDLREAVLINANLYKCDLTKAILTNANLRNADLTKAILTNANLHNADLRDAVASGAADLRSADLSSAYLGGVILDGVDLSNSNLQDSDLTKAILTNANLRNADLTNAILTDANLRNADLRDAVVTKQQLDSVRDLSDALLPKEIESASSVQTNSHT